MKKQSNPPPPISEKPAPPPGPPPPTEIRLRNPSSFKDRYLLRIAKKAEDVADAAEVAEDESRELTKLQRYLYEISKQLMDVICGERCLPSERLKNDRTE